MIQLDILGRPVTAAEQTVACVRDLAAAQAGRSASARDLSLVLDRVLKTGARIALRRGEARALVDLLASRSDDAELAELALTLQTILGGSDS